MQKNIVINILIVLFCGFFLQTKQPIYAAEQFETEYLITYNISTGGETKVTQQITIINKVPDVIATNYALTLKQMEIYDISGEDRKGPLKLDVTRDNNEIYVKAKFNDPTIGEGRKNVVKITYKSKDIATKVGEVWNVYIPQVMGLDKIKKYEVVINVPKELGPKIFVSPTPTVEQNNSNLTILKFDKDGIKSKGINASFGKFQVVNFHLKYQLRNDSFWPVQQVIALPSDIKQRQQTNYTSLDPKPQKLWTDNDGNLMATYNLGPRQKVQVEVIGSAKILGKQINPQQGAKIADLPQELVKNYTKEDKYWETSVLPIKELAQKLFKNEDTVSQNVWEIYNYIVNNLDYNFDIIKQDTIERRGAKFVLENKGTWACMEFTDLFIALARAMGIPARELNGFAFATDKTLTPLSIDFKSGDLLHAWPEYYDPAFGWIAIDPTWGNTSGIDYFTKLDTNHFVFVIKGQSSEYPLPAGAYRFDNEEKQVDVEFAQNVANAEFEPQLYVEPKFSLNLVKIISGKKAWTIKNNSGTFVYGVINDDVILPFQSKELWLAKDAKDLTFMNFNGDEVVKKLPLP